MAEIIVMPKMNLTMEEGVLANWCKSLGDTVKVEEVLCSIENEKAIADMESPTSGVLLKIWGVEGESYRVATPIALIGQLDEDVSALIDQAEKLLTGNQAQETIVDSPGSTSSFQTETRVQAKMLPKVRKLVQELGIDVAALVAYCGDRKITEDEVRAFKQTSLLTSVKNVQIKPGDRRVRMSTIRRTIVANMIESCQKTARLTNVTEVDLTRVMEILKERKTEKLSITALIIKACALSIKAHEFVNTVVDGNDLIYKAEINIGIAVDIPGGLVVPVIRKADTKNIITLTREIADFTAKSQQGTLTQADLTGGTFTVSNVGMLGVESFTPIINFPQTAIMGVGAISRLPRFANDDSEIVLSRYIMKLSLTYDHRVIDGAPAARFSLQVRDFLQDANVLFA